MATALQRIIDWASTLPDWQSDAVRRLLTQDELVESDKDELFRMLLARHGLLEDPSAEPKSRPLTKGDISGTPKVTSKIVLKAITDLANVNAIPDGATLEFGHKGLTVIYGENASGKSGYARILKRACRARDTTEQIHPNVFEPGPFDAARASFKISVQGGPDQTVEWEDGKDPPDVLANISLFDSKCARVILDQNNEPSYLPFGTHVFEAMVDLLKEFRARLVREKPRPTRPEYPDIPSATQAGEFLQKLNKGTDVDSIGVWGSAEEKQLLELEKRLASAEAQDPLKQARRLRATRERVDLLRKDLTAIKNALSPGAVDATKAAVKELKVAEEALAISQGATFAQEPLLGVGGNVWQLLYQAAKDYSTKVAYPDRDFPYIGDDSRCVLCMQPLEETAKERFKRFREHMEQTTKKKVEALERGIQAAHDRVNQIDFSLLAKYKDVLNELSDRSPSAVDQMKEWVSAMEARARDMVAMYHKPQPIPVAPLPPSLGPDLNVLSEKLETEAAKYEKIAKPKELAELKGTVQERRARKLLVSRKPALRAHVKELARISKYDACIAETDFRSITLEGKRIISEVLTPQLLTALSRELDLLGAKDVPLKLDASGREGETLHRMELDGRITGARISLTEILSEGEQKVVAIAGFLAELAVGKHDCPIVFDDPVSSLDHRYRERIAARLVKEAQVRQVILFTHDIAFLVALNAGAEEVGCVHFLARTVRRFDRIAGKLIPGMCWHAMSVKERLNYLQNNLLPDIHRLYPSNMQQYNPQAAMVYNYLRETWEAFVEKDLLAKTVLRFRPGIETQRLKYVEVTTEDCRVIDAAMTKCSKWMIGHDKPEPLDVSRPDPTEIEADIAHMRRFRKTINSRNKKTRDHRKKALEAPTPDAG